MFYTLLEKRTGTNQGSIMIGLDAADLYFYDESVTQDTTASGVNEISCKVKSKTFIFDDAIGLARLRRLYQNYKKRDNQTINTIISNPEGEQKTWADVTNATLASGYKSFREPTDAMSGNLQTANKVQIETSGNGLDEFNSTELEFRLINRGTRARQ